MLVFFLKTFVMLLVAVISEMSNSWWILILYCTFVFPPDYAKAGKDGKLQIFFSNCPNRDEAFLNVIKYHFQ